MYNVLSVVLNLIKAYKGFKEIKSELPSEIMDLPDAEDELEGMSREEVINKYKRWDSAGFDNRMRDDQEDKL